MRGRWMPIVGAALLALSTEAARGQPRVEQVVVYRDGGWLACDVTAADLLDARVRSTVESGLPGSCVWRLAVTRDGDGDLARVLWETSLRLDLWTERFQLTDPRGARELTGWAAADSALAHPRGIRLLRLESVPSELRLRIVVDVIVEPLGPAERARLARYVSDSSQTGADEFALDVGGLLARFLGRKGAGTPGHATRGQSEAFVWPQLPERAAPQSIAPEQHR